MKNRGITAAAISAMLAASFWQAAAVRIPLLQVSAFIGVDRRKQQRTDHRDGWTEIG